MPCTPCANWGAGPIAPAALHSSCSGNGPRVTMGTEGTAFVCSGSSTNPSTAGALCKVVAKRLSPSGSSCARASRSARPVRAPRRRASAAAERESGSAKRISSAIASGFSAAIASTSSAMVSRGQGQLPSASIERRSMSITTTPWSPPSCSGSPQILIRDKDQIESVLSNSLAPGTRHDKHRKHAEREHCAPGDHRYMRLYPLLKHRPAARSG